MVNIDKFHLPGYTGECRSLFTFLYAACVAVHVVFGRDAVKFFEAGRKVGEGCEAYSRINLGNRMLFIDQQFPGLFEADGANEIPCRLIGQFF
jgi:hypothetical protein